MKNVFLIGNGFDLHHYLPTKYLDFMCVAEYLISNTFSLGVKLIAESVYDKSGDI